MRKILLVLVVSLFVVYPVAASELKQPSTPPGVEKYLPENSESFTEDLMHIIKTALDEIAPEFYEAMVHCCSVMAVQILISVFSSFSGIAQKSVNLAGVVTISVLLLSPTKAFIALGVETIHNLSEYNKVLLPVLTSALASQGGVTTSAALYAGTVVLNFVLTTLMTKAIVPLLYAYIVVGISSIAIDEKVLNQLMGLLKWLITWGLKLTTYLFTGYMSITGVVCGAVDASAIKAAKLTISGAVPVIGNIISDASEAVLVGVTTIKNTSGVYGALVILAIWITPFLRVGVQYLLLKITSGICSLIGDKRTVSVVSHFSSAMGFVLAMIGVACVLQLISVVCFLRGVRA